MDTVTLPTRYDLAPAARRVAALLPAITPEQLGDPTPCPAYDVAALLDHLMGLTRGLTETAYKTASGTAAPEASGARLDPDWRTELPDRLAELAAAWREPAAWEGHSEAGGVALPAAVLGVVALDELVVHGWDLARATRQRYSVDGVSARACLEFCRSAPHVFGPRVEVPADAPVFHQVLGYAGRDPRWSA